MTRHACKTKPVSLREWFTCGMCWEVKLGVVSLILSQLLLFWRPPVEPSWRWWLGTVLYWLAIAVLVWGLARDLWLIATTKFERR